MSIPILLRTARRLAQLRRAERRSRHQLEDYQNRAFGSLREYVYARSRFYGAFHKGLAGRPLSELPILTKAVLMENFDELVTNPAIRLRDIEAYFPTIHPGTVFRNRYVVNATGGSTGQRGIFVSNITECVTLLASILRPSIWAGFKPNFFRRPKVANVASALPWHLSNTVFALLGDASAHRLQLDVRSPVKDIVEQLQAFDPGWLSVYASFSRVLAEEQIAGRLRIFPKAIAVHSEVLTAETRQRLESVWGKVVFNVYGTTETGVLAAECPHHSGQHLLEDLTIVEVVDAHGRPVPAGEYGEKVLVTVLFRRTQPLIRYEISDMVRLTAAQCACGRPFRMVESIQGRREEVINLPSVTGGQVAIQPLVFDRVLDTVPAKAWQVVQERDSIDIVLAGLRQGFRESTIADALRQSLAGQGAVSPKIRVILVSDIPRSATGKAPLIRSNVSRAAARSE